MSVSNSPRILVTGATGTIGKELSIFLSAKGVPFRAMVRSVDDARKISELAGAELFEGDFNDEKSIKKALAGIEKAFLLTNSSELAEKQQTTFVEVAGKVGLPYIVKLSQWAASLDSPVRFLRYHAVVENLIRKSDIRHTFLRPNLFMQGLLGFRESISKQGKFFGAIGDAKVSMVDVRDIAAAAGHALTETGHEGKTYNLTGPEALSHYEIAEKLSEVLERPVQFVDLSSKELRAMLAGIGFPAWQADGLVEDYEHYKRGEAAEVTSGVLDATGHTPLDLGHFVRDHIDAFRA